MSNDGELFEFLGLDGLDSPEKGKNSAPLVPGSAGGGGSDLSVFDENAFSNEQTFIAVR